MPRFLDRSAFTGLLAVMVGACGGPLGVAGGSATPGLAADAAPPGSLPLRQVSDVPLTGGAVRFDYQCLDPATHLLFVAHTGADAVTVFDPATGKQVAEIPAIAHARGLVAVPELGRVYASAVGSHEIVAIDSRTLQVIGRIPDDADPDGLAVDPVHLKLFASDEHAGRETVVDLRTGHPEATVQLGGEAGNVKFDPFTGTMLVNDASGDLVVVDPVRDRIVGRHPLAQAAGNHGLLLDPDRRVAYVACSDNAWLLTVELRTFRVVATASLGPDPDVLAFDPGLRRLYVAGEGGVVSAFDAAGPEPVLLGAQLLAPHAHTVAVDPATHRVYLPLEDVGGQAVMRIMRPLHG